MRKFKALFVGLLLVAAMSVAFLPSSFAAKEKFPVRTIALDCPFGAGGGTDLVTRAFAEVAKDYFKQSVIVENRTGGAGVIGLTSGMNAKPDGYTITTLTVELITLPQLGLAPQEFNYKKFTPIGLVNIEPSAITVRADSPFKTMSDFIKYAKENPNKLRVGNSGTGAIWHLATIGLEMKTGIKLVQVPFQEGAAQAAIALLGGHIDAVAVSPQEVNQYVNSGKLRILGVASDKRLSSFPKVKTFKEQGINLEISCFRGFAVPKDTPPAVVKTIRNVFQKTVKDSKFKTLMKKATLTYVPMSGDQFGKMLDQQNELFKGITEQYKKQNLIK